MPHTTYRCFSTACRSALLVAAMVTAAISPAAAQQDFYTGKQITFIVGAGVGRRIRPAGAHGGAASRQAHPRQSDRRGPEHAGRGQHRRHQFHVQHRAEGRHHHRADPARHAARQADLSVRHALRPRQIRLGRQPQQRDRRHVVVECNVPASHGEGSVREGIDRRRHRQRRSRDNAAALQFADRNEVQDRVGLQQHRADRLGDRARRGAGHRRLVVVELQGGAAGLDTRQAR